jgi:hypothetical protein
MNLRRHEQIHFQASVYVSGIIETACQNLEGEHAGWERAKY